MPTAARLAAALCLALTALATTHNILPLLPEGQGIGRLYEINIGLGLLVGWITIGTRVGRGMWASINNGVTGGFILVFWALVVHGFSRMWKLSLRKKFGDPWDAVTGFFEEAVGFAGYLGDLNVLASLVIGAVVTGVIAELADRNFS
jgi:hypothetical protein